MKIRIIVFSLIALAAFTLSCEEKADPAEVWGWLECNQCQGKLNMNGTLGESGENYYGWCKRTESGFEFAVGNDKPGRLSSGFYFEVRGIEGSPTQGVYSSGEETKDDQGFQKAFSSARVVNVNDWKIASEDIDSNTCFARLFAEATEEELTPAQFGSTELQYFVEIRCTGLSVNSTNDIVLTGMAGKVWFNRCEG